MDTKQKTGRKRRASSENPSAYTGTIPKGAHQNATPRISACAACLDLFDSKYIQLAQFAYKKGKISALKTEFLQECATHGINRSTSNVHWAIAVRNNGIRPAVKRGRKRK